MPPTHFQIRTMDGHIELYEISELSRLVQYFKNYDQDESCTIAKVSFYWNNPHRNLILRRNDMDWFVPDFEHSSDVGLSEIDEVYDAIMAVPVLYEVFGTRVQWAE